MVATIDRRAEYQAFLDAKRLTVPPSGLLIDERDPLNYSLFPWQRQITRWALRRGKAAIFADCGLGKTLMQLVWAHHICDTVNQEGVPITRTAVLILAPLAVAKQTKLEGERFGIDVTLCRKQKDVEPGCVNITNYDLLHNFDPSTFIGVVCDESSILKGDGPMRKELQAFVEHIPYRLACTATPAPNDTQELVNHAEWLGVMRGDEVLSLFFTQDGNSTHKWRLKGHARKAFWQWVATWAVAFRKPSDIGFSDEGYELPKLTFVQHTVEAPLPSDALFQAEAKGIKEQRQVRRDTIDSRVELAVSIAKQVKADGRPAALWCGLNDEGDALEKALPWAVQAAGKNTREEKEDRLLGFATGEHPGLITKGKIAGFGMNLQICSDLIMVGLGNSYEEYYQIYKRHHRFGQKREVTCHVIVSEADGAVVANLERKAMQDQEQKNELVGLTDLHAEQAQAREEMTYSETEAKGASWKLWQGDSVLRCPEIPTESVGHIVFSPPFPSMYVYTNSPHDIGNCQRFEELLDHFRFLMRDLKRILLPGRTCAVHLTQGLAFKSRDGYAGRKDFRGKTIEAMEGEGWIYHSEILIDKDPQVKAIRTKDRGLLFKSLCEDSAVMAPCLADYLLIFRKPGENPVPIQAGISSKYKSEKGWITDEEWIEWAAPVWYRASNHYPGGIRETDVLNVKQARETNDERHLCPLQLGVSARSIKIYSNPASEQFRTKKHEGLSKDLWQAGATVFSPFAGIGSELYSAIRMGRIGQGIELKPNYYQQAVRNCHSAEAANSQATLGLEFEE